MAVNLSSIWGAGAQLLDNSGNVLSGGKIYTYAAGTTTQVTTYTSNTGVTANSNPIILNSAGRVPYEIWLTDGQNYKFVLKDSNDVLIGTWDNLSGINSNFVNYVNQQEIQTATSGQTVFNLTTMHYLPGTNSLSVFVDGVNQYGPGAQYAFEETNSNTVTFASGLHVGAEVKFTSSQIQNAGAVDASQVSYTPPFTDSVATNVEERLAQTVSVKDFGAVGDGVTDDTDAIQNALNASNYVYVPDGTYLVSNVQLKHEKSFVFGSGTLSQLYTEPAPSPSTGYLLWPNGSIEVSIISVSADVKEVYIDGLSFDASGYGTDWVNTTSIAYPIVVGVRTLTSNSENFVEKVSVTNCVFNEFFGRGITATGQVYICANKFYNCTGYWPYSISGGGYDGSGDGIYITNAYKTTPIYGGLVSSNLIYTNKNGRAGIVCEFEVGEVTITGNQIGDKYERGIHLESNSNSKCYISSNKIYAQNGILASYSSIHAVSNEFYVAGTTGKLYENLTGAFTFIGSCTDSFIENNLALGTSLKDAQVFYCETGLKDCVVTNNTFSGRVVLVGAVRVKFENNEIGYPYTVTTADKIYVGGCDFVTFTNNTINNISVGTYTSAIWHQWIGNIFNYDGAVTTNVEPLTFIGVSSAKLNIDNNQFGMLLNPSSQAIYWENGTTGKLGSLSNNSINNDASSAQEIIGPGRTSYSHPFNVSTPNFWINNSYLKRTLKLKTIDGSGYQGRQEHGTAIPVSGAWEQNDIIWNTNMASGQPQGWVCTVAGTPGTWKAMSNLA